ncbi:TetR/AcrR family transcriptional regulator [Polymorphospora sp. NPDC051019]|uniref:TetR/AcrR family transcriptional regulator n=1 Tax=Polymorphospora sp. NPDC051019 TaxID=3155725 RepID=UPI00343B449A
MDPRPPTSGRRAPRSRAQRQQETREALILAALDAFTRDGYHAASLEGIANEAGFSKGAVYSNFEGKAELFLAVMDHNLEMLRGEGWDPLAAAEGDTETPVPDAATDDAARMVRGFSLATLEFIATAARDDTLIHALRQRVQVMIDAYGRVAADGRPTGEVLPVDDVAQLMAAFDQGVSVLTLSGIASMDGALMRTGLRRLMDPAGAVGEPAPRRDGHTSSRPDVQAVRRLMRDLPGS